MFMIDLGAESYYSILGVSPDADVDEINKARNQIMVELKRKYRVEQDPQEKQRIEKRQAEISAIGGTLASPEKRSEYDRANAHLRFFTMRVAAAPMFVENADRIYVLHRAIRDHLAKKGVDLAPLSDIDRSDFSADETPIEFLDNLLK